MTTWVVREAFSFISVATLVACLMMIAAGIGVA